jgi:hypothetical protein
MKAALLFAAGLTVLSIAAVNAAPDKPIVSAQDEGVHVQRQSVAWFIGHTM